MTDDIRPIEVTLPTVTLHGIELGVGPLVMFFHGITANGYVFLPLMKALAQDFRCVSFDQRGHGRSGKPASGYGGADYASDIALAAHQLKGGRAMVIGHSLGARNAIIAGTEYEHFIASVVAIDFVPFIESAVFDALDTRVAGGDQTFADLDAVRTYLANRYSRLPADAVDRRAQFGYAAAEGGYRPLADANAMMATSTGLRADLAAYLDGIRVPTLLIRGADSKLVSPEAWRKSRALRPDIKAVELAGADHYVPEEVPQAVATEVLSFWKSTRRT